MERHRCLAAAFLMVALSLSGLAFGQDAKPPAPTVTVESIQVTPANPGPDTLCKLSIQLKNHTDKPVSGFGFQVQVNGVDLPVYANQRYLDVLAPGEQSELALYNFWSSETHRPPAKDGSLEVEVRLTEAHYVEQSTEDGVPTWTLLGEVGGLPSAKSARRPFGGKVSPAASSGGR